MKYADREIIQLLDLYCAEAAMVKHRFAPDHYPAGKVILALPAEGKRQVLLAIFGCLTIGVEGYLSDSRWGTGAAGLKHSPESSAVQRLFTVLSMKPMPMTDSDFCEIIQSTKGFELFPDHFDYLLELMSDCLKNYTVSLELANWLDRMREAVQNVHEAFQGHEIEAGRHKRTLDRIDAFIKPRE